MITSNRVAVQTVWIWKIPSWGIRWTVSSCRHVYC